MFRLFLVACALVVASTAFAEGEWRSTEGGSTTGGGGAEIGSLGGGFLGFGGSVAFFEFNSTYNSTLLDVSKCSTWSALFDPDVATSLYNSAQIKMWTCIGGAAGERGTSAVDESYCSYQYNTAGPTALTGDPALGLHKVMGSSDILIAVEVTANTSSDTGIVAVVCNE